MTVGIGAVCEADTDNPKVVVAADRLVTSGQAARREYEHTSSKMLSIHGTNGDNSVCAVGIGAGSVALADEVFYKVDQKVAGAPPESARSLAQYGMLALQEVVQETIERQVLSPHNLNLQTFNQTQGQMNPQVVQGIYQEITQKKDEVLQQVNILLAAVDSEGAHLFNIRQNDLARNDTIGYLTVGSGAEPANSTFIRNRYDDTCELDDALLDVTEAKAQAEEAQGVGRKMDLAVLDQSGRRDLDDGEIDELREVYEEVIKEEQSARQSVIEDREYSLE